MIVGRLMTRAVKRVLRCVMEREGRRALEWGFLFVIRSSEPTSMQRRPTPMDSTRALYSYFTFRHRHRGSKTSRSVELHLLRVQGAHWARHEAAGAAWLHPHCGRGSMHNKGNGNIRCHCEHPFAMAAPDFLDRSPLTPDSQDVK